MITAIDPVWKVMSIWYFDGGGESVSMASSSTGEEVVWAPCGNRVTVDAKWPVWNTLRRSRRSPFEELGSTEQRY